MLFYFHESKIHCNNIKMRTTFKIYSFIYRVYTYCITLNNFGILKLVLVLNININLDALFNLDFFHNKYNILN